MQNTPALRAASTMASASAAVAANGFSTSTGLPAAIAASASARWLVGGVAT